MPDDPLPMWTRRRFLHASLLLPVAAALTGPVAAAVQAAERAAGDEPVLDPTPPCDDGDDATPRQTAGPFYTPNSPARRSLLEKGMPGVPLVLAGRVYSPGCRPLPGVLVDFWHADGDGEYDNEGFRCRGHQFTDRAGRFRLETVVPGLYPGRTRHYHVRVQAAGGRILTTQLYFPEEARNRRDGLYRPELLMKVRDGGTRKLATFDFVLAS